MNGMRRTTRSTATAVPAIDDENHPRPAARLAKTKLAQENAGGAGGAAKSVAPVTRRRAALGDLSNVNNENQRPAAAAAGARGGVRAAKAARAADAPEDATKRKRVNAPSQASESQVEAKKLKSIVPAACDVEHDDLDADDMDDPLMVAEYVEDIFRYMGKLELDTMPDADYMAIQPDLTWRMRGILSDWLIEVHSKFRLLPETLFLAMNITDRFLSLRRVTLPKLQLVGVTALFIASKYEEVMCPSIQNFVYMGDGGYTEEDIIKAENFILMVLNFNLAYPNPMNFLRRISKADDYNIQVRTVGKYLVEIAMVDHRLLGVPPSKLCAAGMLLAREMLDRGEWNGNLIYYSGYQKDELKYPYQVMVDYLSQEPPHEAFFRKYASKKFMKASLFVRDWVRKGGARMFEPLEAADSGSDTKEF